MAVINIDALLKDVSPDDPCGPALNYDPAYLELEQAIQGKPEQQVGDAVIPAEDPDWRAVRKLAGELAERTRDLRVILYLTVAAAKLEGLPGLRDGLVLLKGVLERHWEGVHPRLDPEDNNDPTERMNIIASVAVPPETFGDVLAVQRRLMEAPLTNSAQIGRFSFRDLKIAQGELPPPAEGKAPDSALVEAAFDDTSTDDLKATADACDEAIETTRRIDQVLTEKAGADRAPDLSRFEQLLTEVGNLVKTYLAKRGVGAAPTPAAAGGGAGPGGTPLSGEIQSIREVLLALDLVCRYYERHEVSSPVPLMIKGAQRLVSQGFLEIARVLTPDTIDRLKEIAGIRDQTE